MSPALSHVDQSRNTLSFVITAKEVTNTAQVNTVVADEQLVNHLQKEVTILNAELLLSPDPSSSQCCWKKEQKIQQFMDICYKVKIEKNSHNSLIGSMFSNNVEPMSS